MFAKKSLGQYWLRSERVARAIVQTAELKSGETVLEIGPGTGFLTKFLLETGAEIMAIEKDERAINFLEEKFAAGIKGKKLKLFHGDILTEKVSLPEKYKLVANIPYYITGQIVRKFLSGERQPERVVLLVQDEVAKRIVAVDKRESLLSISVKAYGTPEYIQKVPAKLFAPAPKVASAILLISNISKNNFEQNKISEEKFFALVKQGFNNKRKMLRNHLNLPPAIFARCKIKDTSRAEDLTLANWLCLAK